MNDADKHPGHDAYHADWMLRDDPLAPARFRRGLRNGLILAVPLWALIFAAFALLGRA